MPENSISPNVSIIMPTYNRAGLIGETIESIRDQTHTNWELIIVDDGSDDNTEEIVAGIKDVRIKFHKAGKTGIGIKLKNIGIELSHGELIAFIDSDDLWAPTKLEKQIKALQDHPDAAFSLTGGYNFRKKGEPLDYFYKEKEGIKYGNIFLSFFKSEAAVLPPTLIFERKCMHIIHEFIKTAPSSDVEFVLGLALHFKAVILYEPLFYRRLHDTGYSSMNWEKGYHEGISVIHKYRENKALPSNAARDALFRLYLNFGEKWLGYKKRSKAIGKFLKAWKNRPFSITPLRKIAKALLYALKRK